MNELKIVQFIGLYADCEWAADSGQKKMYFTLYVGLWEQSVILIKTVCDKTNCFFHIRRHSGLGII